jgi:hypothetical protein
MAGPILLSKARRSLYFSVDPRWRLKLGLSIAAVIFSLISILLFAAAIPQWNANFFHSKGPTRGDWTDGMSIGPLLFTVFFGISSNVFFFFAKKAVPTKVSILTLSLILLTLTPSLFLAGHGSLFLHWRPSAVRNRNGILNCNALNIFTRECEPTMYTIGELQIGAIVVGSLAWAMVFVLFLVSIYELRANKVHKPRLPRRLTLMISDMEKGYRRDQDREYRTRRSHSSRHGHRQQGTREYYQPSLKREKSSDTVPIVYVRRPDSVHSSSSSSSGRQQ